MYFKSDRVLFCFELEKFSTFFFHPIVQVYEGVGVCLCKETGRITPWTGHQPITRLTQQSVTSERNADSTITRTFLDCGRKVESNPGTSFFTVEEARQTFSGASVAQLSGC